MKGKKMVITLKRPCIMNLKKSILRLEQYQLAMIRAGDLLKGSPCLHSLLHLRPLCHGAFRIYWYIKPKPGIGELTNNRGAYNGKDEEVGDQAGHNGQVKHTSCSELLGRGITQGAIVPAMAQGAI